MTKRIFQSICFVTAAVLLAALVLIMGILYEYFTDNQMDQLKKQTELAATAVEVLASAEDRSAYLNNLDVADARITWIDPEGTVLFDNKKSSAEMENHLDREEIKEALETGTGVSSRYSTTLMERQLYCARRLSDGTVLRVSGSQLTWWSLMLGMLRPILIVIALALGISLYLAFRLSRMIVKPLNEMNLDHPKTENIYRELEPFVDRITVQQKQLRAQASELEQKKSEFEAATKNMTEGIVLLNDRGVILSINDAASALLGISNYCIGKDLMLFNNSFDIQELLRISEEGQHCEKSITIGSADYQFNASPVFQGGKVTGIALIIFDITEKEKSEQIRREFTANVSHELKTPLQSISGYAELLSNGMVKEQDIPEFAKKIHGEAKRMISLVDDIIRLSHLDEGASDMPKEQTDLFELAKTTVRILEPIAKEADVTLRLKGVSAQLYGIPQLLSGILYNLCDNAIKYNKKGGKVTLTVEDLPDCVRLTCADTGIGIPAEQKERIFERFYRVNKSRSKEVGGTGLGLSIVKHAARLHGAEIEVQSVLDKGTTVLVRFPKKEDRKEKPNDL